MRASYYEQYHGAVKVTRVGKEIGSADEKPVLEENNFEMIC